MPEAPERTWTRGPHYDYHYHEPVPNSVEYHRADLCQENREKLRKKIEALIAAEHKPYDTLNTMGIEGTVVHDSGRVRVLREVLALIEEKE